MAIMNHISVLQARELAGMRKAVAALTEQRSRRRRYIRTEESLTVGDVQDLMTEKNGGGKEAAEQPAERVRKERHCGRCGKTGHNARTCAVIVCNGRDKGGGRHSVGSRRSMVNHVMLLY
jgi:NADH pyrophosphatase NudC (nudix superfamily)